MAPPPVTPSPHRFLATKPKEVSRPLPSQLSSSQRFIAAPRFSVPASQQSSRNLPASTPSFTRYSTPTRHTPRQYEAIEDPSDELEPDSQDQDQADTAYESEDHDNDEAAYELEAREAKRRRVSEVLVEDVVGQSDYEDVKQEPDGFGEDPDLLSSSIPILSSPPRQNAHHTATPSAPRFLPMSTAQASQAARQELSRDAFVKAPKFRPSEAQLNSPATDPLPDQFSPHRRGERFVAGGLAAELQGWLVDMENRSSDYGGRKNQDSMWAVKIVIDDIGFGPASSMSVVRGRQVHETVVDNLGVVDVILAGEGIGEGLAKGGAIQKGKIVGIKAPVWEVVLEGRKLGVGVNWRVLN